MEPAVCLAINYKVRAPVAVIIGGNVGSFDLASNLATGKTRGVNVDVPFICAQIGDLRGCRGKCQRTDDAVSTAGKRKVETNRTVNTDGSAIVNVRSDYI